MTTHWLDRAYAAHSSSHKLFSLGWGDPAVLEDLSAGRFFAPSAAELPPPVFTPARRSGTLDIRDATFESPLSRLPATARTAHLRWLRSPHAPARGAALILAGSREEGFSRRTAIFAPLAREGLELFLLENPFYGLRRPPGQDGGNVATVAEQMLLNLGMIEESRALLSWLTRTYERVAIAGYSMGGHMAACAGVLCGAPIGIASMAAGASPVPIYTRDLLSRSVDFAALAQAQDSSLEAARSRLSSLFALADLTRLPQPLAPERAVLVAIERDGYVSLEECDRLYAHWPGSSLRKVGGGHVSAVFTQRAALRAAVRDATLGAGR